MTLWSVYHTLFGVFATFTVSYITPMVHVISTLHFLQCWAIPIYALKYLEIQWNWKLVQPLIQNNASSYPCMPNLPPYYLSTQYPTRHINLHHAVPFCLTGYIHYCMPISNSAKLFSKDYQSMGRSISVPNNIIESIAILWPLYTSLNK